MLKKTTYFKPEVPAWHQMDASTMPLGRLASEAAKLLIGKGKTTFSYNQLCGDIVVVTNAANLKVTGKKSDDKHYYRHSNYMGGIKDQTLAEMVAAKPEEAIRQAVKGMLPNNKLRAQMLKRLKVYAGSEHSHSQISN